MKKLARQQVFRDPLYGYIHVDYVIIKKLINSFCFQRLRRIKQLSGVYMVFHCAEHSRFQHSLGVYEVANRFLSVPELKSELNEREQLLFLSAALLHDIGHGAYSHAFEDVFLVNHEKIGASIIVKNEEIRSILDEVDKNFASDVSSVIAKDGKFPLIETLISSQLDVDRLDYLARDAYYTGTTYGRIDFERIVRVLRIKDSKVVFKSSGIHAIENYLISRYHMYWQVYYHPTARAYEVVLEKIYQRIRDLINENYQFNENIEYLKNIMEDPTDITSYLEIDDNYINSLIARFTKTKDEVLRNLSIDFLNRHIWEYLDDNEENKEQIAKIKNKLSKYYYSSRTVEQNTYKVDGKKFGLEIDILLENGDIQTLTEFSSVINSLATGGFKKDPKFFYKNEK
ncbi:HD domain-containing protein [Acholeplasma sp. OttesenSCG-928-E16]|nr:HD domain-containing protein [Acholeplasma sp. OttesenSCG-928-E16]